MYGTKYIENYNFFPDKNKILQLKIKSFTRFFQQKQESFVTRRDLALI